MFYILRECCSEILAIFWKAVAVKNEGFDESLCFNAMSFAILNNFILVVYSLNLLQWLWINNADIHTDTAHALVNFSVFAF